MVRERKGFTLGKKKKKPKKFKSMITDEELNKDKHNPL